MTRKNINIGSNQNDGTGDPLRTAFDKINDNFIELYGGDNDLNTLDANLDVNNFAITTGKTNGDITVTPNGTGSIKLGAVKFKGTTISSDDSSIININEGLVVDGTANISGATTLGGTLAVGTSLALATGATVTGIDNGALGSSATLLATQGAIKTYVDAQVTASDLDFTADDSTTNSIDLDSEVMQFSGDTGITTSATGNTVSIAIDGTVATLTGSQTLTNKVLTNPTINAATMIGAVAIDGVTITDNTIKANASNADLELDGSGTGAVKVLANAQIVGTLTTADITNTNNITTTQLDADGVRLKDNKITTFASNANLELAANGTGVIDVQNAMTTVGQTITGNVAITGRADVDNLRLDGNTISATTGGITLSPAAGQNVSAGGILTAAEADFTLMEATTVRADTIQNDTSDGDISISTQGTGNINVNSIKIINLADPTSAQDAATKAYVDSQGGGGGGSVTASSSTTFTNKTLDANGTGNNISNIDIGNMTAAVVVTESEGIGSNDNDTTLPTSAAVKDYVDNQVSGTSQISVSNTNAAVSDSGSNGTFTVTADGNTEMTVTDDGMQLGASGARVNTILDEDSMSSNSATSLATQQSIKAYVDANSGSANTGDITFVGSTIISPSNADITMDPAGTGLVRMNTDKIALGSSAGATSQGADAVAIGKSAGSTSQGQKSVAIGDEAGTTSQSQYTVAIGRQAGNNTQGEYSVAVGAEAGEVTQGTDSVAIGRQAGYDSGDDTVFVGSMAGGGTTGTRGAGAIGIGTSAGTNTSGQRAIAVGYAAQFGGSGNGSYADSIGIGSYAGWRDQRDYTVAIGYEAGYDVQNSYGVAIGYRAGKTSAGDRAVAIGYLAGQNTLHANSIVLNAKNATLDTVGTSRFYVKPVRSASGNSQPLLRYDEDSGEISFMPHIEINDNLIQAVQTNADLELSGNGTGATKINGKLVISASQADGSSVAIDTTKSVAVLAGNSSGDDNDYTLADGTTIGQIIYLVRGPNSNRSSIHVTFSKFENDGTTASNTRKEIFSQYMSVVPCIWNGTAWCVGQHQN